MLQCCEPQRFHLVLYKKYKDAGGSKAPCSLTWDGLFGVGTVSALPQSPVTPGERVFGERDSLRGAPAQKRKDGRPAKAHSAVGKQCY